MIGQGCKMPEGTSCEPKGRKSFCSCNNGVVGALFVEEAIVLCSLREGMDQRWAQLPRVAHFEILKFRWGSTFSTQKASV